MVCRLPFLSNWQENSHMPHALRAGRDRCLLQGTKAGGGLAVWSACHSAQYAGKCEERTVRSVQKGVRKAGTQRDREPTARLWIALPSRYVPTPIVPLREDGNHRAVSGSTAGAGRWRMKRWPGSEAFSQTWRSSWFEPGNGARDCLRQRKPGNILR